jgi:pimeloyl-ACP methyl ester carboxylesterase
MAPVARRLAADLGVLEPLQTTISLEQQVEELSSVLKDNARPPVTLIGFSWGAWLSFIYAARHPESVRKLILVGSGPFQAGYAAQIERIRLSRLSDDEKAEIRALRERLAHPKMTNKNAAFARFGQLFTKADAYDPIGDESERIDHRVDVFLGVWPEAATIRQTGELLNLGEAITCPVVAIHGDYDPHPAAGVREPLTAVLRDFRFVLLEKCGHKPWIERKAREEFFRVLRREASS